MRYINQIAVDTEFIRLDQSESPILRKKLPAAEMKLHFMKAVFSMAAFINGDN